MKRWQKGVGYTLGGLVAVLLIAAVAVYGLSESRTHRKYAIVPPLLTIPSDSAAIAHGEHLSRSIAGCTDCHGESLGGKVLLEDGPLGRMYSKNLTRGKGGLGAHLTDADYLRAIRHGLAPDSTPLIAMPSSNYANLTDEDATAIIAFVKSRPPVDNEVPTSKLGPLGRALLVTGLLPILHAERIDHAKPHVASVPAGPTPEYGAYLAGFGCKGCHGPALAGGKIKDGDPAWPPAANLTPAGPTTSWSETDFRKLLREGKRPDGSSVNEVMPWRGLKLLTDEEIRALYLYLRSIPAAPTPGLKPAAAGS